MDLKRGSQFRLSHPYKQIPIRNLWEYSFPRPSQTKVTVSNQSLPFLSKIPHHCLHHDSQIVDTKKKVVSQATNLHFTWKMLEGILLPSNMAAKTTFWLYLVKRLIVTLRCAVNVTTSSFQHFSCKFVFRKG